MSTMLSKFISIGDKIELQAVGNNAGKEMQRDGQKRIFYSRVQGFVSEDTLEITMPMEQTKLILLPVDSEFDLKFYSASGPYQCFVRIIDRYKSNNIYLLVVEMISNLRKYQRREFYRFSCALEMCARTLQEEEIQALEKSSDNYILTPGLPLRQSVIVDISGGGLRFISTQKYEEGSLIYISYHLMKGDKKKKYEVVGKVLSARELENRPGTWEHRVQYYDMDQKTREEIIKYIFEEERKSRRKGNGS